MSAIAATFDFMDADFAAVDPLRALAMAARDGQSAAFTQLYERTYQLAQTEKVMGEVEAILNRFRPTKAITEGGDI